MAKGQSLYDWCMENGEWGQQLLFEFGDGNNSQQFIDEETGMIKGPMEFSRGTNTKIIWTCKEGHRWYMNIKSRTSQKQGCPYCVGKRVTDENSLKTWCINNIEQGNKILNEWTGISDKGEFFDISEVAVQTKKKMLWRCANGHEWYCRIHDRTIHKSGCPYCMGHIASDDCNLQQWCIVNSGKHDLELEWTGICADGNIYSMVDVTKASSKKFLWRCKNGHEWETSVNARTSGKTGCPYCRSIRLSKEYQKATKGENDLYTWCLENGEYGIKLLKEWTGIQESGEICSINDVIKGSFKKYKWICEKGHEWYATVSHRTACKSGCPYCSKAGTSYPEQFLYRALIQIYPNTISRGKFRGVEYDISIPEEKTCIEYSGVNWHADKLNRDEMKANLCESHGVKFIQIYAHNGEIDTEDTFEDSLIIYKVATNKDIHNQQLTEILDHMLKSFGHSLSEIDIEKAQTEAFNFMHNIESDTENTEVDSLSTAGIQIKPEDF